MDIGEVAAASAGDEDFAAGECAVVEEGDAAAFLAREGSTEEAGCAGAEDDRVELAGGGCHCLLWSGKLERTRASASSRV